MKKCNNSRVQSNLLQQNCFVRDSRLGKDLLCSSSPESFLSIDEVVTSKGVELKESVNPYPITPQYVDSFVESSDYRKDPFAAIAAGTQKQNLGDISDVQKLVAMDYEQARELYSKLSEVFSKAADPKAADPKPADPKAADTDISGGNV